MGDKAGVSPGQVVGPVGDNDQQFIEQAPHVFVKCLAPLRAAVLVDVGEEGVAAASGLDEGFRVFTGLVESLEGRFHGLLGSFSFLRGA